MTHLANISHHRSHIINIIKTEEDNEATYDKIIKNDLAWVRGVSPRFIDVRAKRAVPAFILRSCWQGARPRMFTPPRCEPGALQPAPLKCEYMALPCRRAPYRAPPRPYAAATVRAPQPKVKDEKPPGGAFTRDEERPPCRPLPSAACHGALFSPVGSMARR